MRSLLTLVVLVLLAGCSKQEPAATASDAGNPASEAPAPASLVEALPGGVDFDVASHLRSDKTYQTKTGAARRRVAYELLEATPGQARDVVTAKLAEAGYVAGEATPDKKKEGQYSIKYKKKKAPTITVIFYPTLVKKPINPAARSMIAMSWQVKKAPETPAPVATAQ